MSVPLTRRLARLAGHAEGALALLARVRAENAEGRDIVHLEIGDPDFPTPAHVVQAAVEALAQGHTHYPPAAGLPELREAIARHVSATRGVAVSPDRVVVTPGSKAVMFYTLAALAGPGAEIVCPDPGMPEFAAVARSLGARVVRWRARPADLRPDLDHLAAILTERTRLVFLVSPGNPTGVVLGRAELAQVASLIGPRHCYVFADEIYHAIHFGEAPPPSLVALPGMAERTILSDGFSKTYAMTGWRLGFGVLPSELVEPVVRLQRHSASAAATFTQRAGLAALEGPRDAVLAMVAAYRQRRDVLVAGLRGLPGVECVEPEGALYVFPRVAATGLTSRGFAERALAEGVALLPGPVFGPAGRGHIRLSYTAGVSRLEEALRRLERLVARVPRGRPGRAG